MRSSLFYPSAVGLFALAMVPSTAVARDKDDQTASPPKEYRDLMACRTVADSAARLACFDRHSAELDSATHSHAVVIADREAVKSARRGLFGFTAPVGKLLGFGGDDEEEIKQIDSTIARVGHSADGGWRLALADDSTWEQNDIRGFVLSPKVGNTVRISRGALGSYFVAVQGQRAVKMRRVQ